MTARPLEIASLKVKNHRLGVSDMTLRELDESLTPRLLGEIWGEYEKFMIGGSSRAARCINELLGPSRGSSTLGGSQSVEGMLQRRFTEIDSCVELQRQFMVHTPQKIHDHCMPELL